tara:strand:- start:208 stop:381 length:174 start_codon:yes stop_codon:yes gene_type:complete
MKGTNMNARMIQEVERTVEIAADDGREFWSDTTVMLMQDPDFKQAVEQMLDDMQQIR